MQSTFNAAIAAHGDGTRELIRRANDALPADVLRRLGVAVDKGGVFVCPSCKSHKPTATFRAETGDYVRRWRCTGDACDAGGSVVELVAKHKGLSEANAARRILGLPIVASSFADDLHTIVCIPNEGTAAAVAQGMAPVGAIPNEGAGREAVKEISAAVPVADDDGQDHADEITTSIGSANTVENELAAFVGSETRPEKGVSMSQHSPKRAARQRPSTDTAAALDRLVGQFRDKLDGKTGKIKAPAGPEFKAGGAHEVWGTIARQAGNAAGADATRATIDDVLTDYPAEVADDVWARLVSPEPVVIPIDGDARNDEAGFDSSRTPDSDMARGMVLLPHFIGRVRWVQEWKELGWLYWNGRHWERNAAAVERLAKQILPREIAAKWGNYDAAAEAAKRVNVINAVWWIRSHEEILIKPERLDAEPWLLNLDNGTLDLRTMELRPHDPADLCTKISPTAYDPAADCPLFRATLEKFLPDVDVRTFLLRHFGSALTGIITHLKLPILYGLGRNGKSTITNALAFVLGPEYCVTLDAEVLTDDGSKRKTSDRLYHIASLHGMRFVVVNELEENCILRGPQLKALVSSDKMTGRRPYEMPFSFWPSHKIVMLTNHKPRLRSTDEGTMRRLALVPFEVQIHPDDDVKDFGDKLKAEAAGILNLLVDGCKDWQDQGHDAPVPPIVAAATESYRNEEDIIGRFVETCIKKVAGGFVTGKEVFETFKAWCEESGIEPMNGTVFGRKFGGLFDKHRSKSSVKYEGIIINRDWKSTD